MDEQFKSIGGIHDRVIEECAELIQAIMKSNRFGHANYHPDRPDSPNWKEILDEISDVRRTIDEYERLLQKNFP